MSEEASSGRPLLAECPVMVWRLFLNCRPWNAASWASLAVFGWATTLKGFTLLDFFANFIVLGFFATLLNGFSFAVNNVFDVEEDRKAGKASNLVAARSVSRNKALAFSFIIGGASVAFFAYTGGVEGGLLSLLCIVIGFLYSAPPFRFKEKPILDIVSHGFFLGSLLVLLGAYFRSGTPNNVTYVYTVAFFFISCIFQLQNLLGDYFFDRDAGVKTSIVRLGSLEKGRIASTILMLIGCVATVAATWHFSLDVLPAAVLLSIQVLNLLLIQPKTPVYVVYTYQRKIQPYLMVCWGLILLLVTLFS
ncbi:MAG: UbiA prenyltransferase family protein [Candidatus Freyarchaeota archaeon]|nr:UbiA prenyltransferase family protein [Candidatus Jordarchaeia archaeon]